MIVRMRMPVSPVLERLTETPRVVVTYVTMIVGMRRRRLSVLRFFALALGALPDIGHRGASFRVDACPNASHAMCHLRADAISGGRGRHRGDASRLRASGTPARSRNAETAIVPTPTRPGS